MSFELQVAADALRCAALAGAAAGIAGPLARLLAQTRSRMVWVALWGPWLVPSLLVSYAYAPLALALGAHPGGASALHSVALLFRLAPLAALVRLALPPAWPAEAGHLTQLHGLDPRPRWKLRRRHAGPGPLAAALLVFVFAFTDFELASLWSVKTWPVLLFDAHTGGLAPALAMKLLALPLALEIAALVGIAVLLRQGGHSEPWSPPSRGMQRVAGAWLAVAAIALTVVPLALVAPPAFRALPTLLEHFALTRELLASLAFAAVATLFAVSLARSSPRRALVVLLPGLLGPLPLALLLVALFQLPLLRPLYDSPAPLLVALTLLAVVVALPLRWLGERAAAGAELHVAQLAATPAARGLRWRLDGRRRALAVGVVFSVAYFDFTAGSILAPLRLPTILPRLHNLAHYGQTPTLSALLLAATLAPALVLWLLLAGARRFRD